MDIGQGALRRYTIVFQTGRSTPENEYISAVGSLKYITGADTSE